MKAQPYNNALGGGGITEGTPVAPRNYDGGFYTYKIGFFSLFFGAFFYKFL